MKRYIDITSQINSLTALHDDMVANGINKEVAGQVASLEGDNVLPYPVKAYSNHRSVTFLTASTESVFSMVVEKVTRGVEIILDYVARFLKYIKDKIVKLMTADFKKQSEFNKKANKEHAKAKEKFKQKKKEAEGTEKHQAFVEAEQKLENDEYPALTEAAERLRACFTVLTQEIYENSNEVRKVFVDKNVFKRLNEYGAAFASETTEVLKRHANGTLTKSGVWGSIANSSINKDLFLKQCEEINKQIASAKFRYVKNHDIDGLTTVRTRHKPHEFLSEVTDNVREAFSEPSDFDYIKLVIEEKALPASDVFSMIGKELVDFFSGADVRKTHADFTKVHKELAKAVKDMRRRGTSSDELRTYQNAVSDSLSNMVAITYYGIRYRQICKLIMRSMIRFMNAESAYIFERIDLINGLD